MSHLRAVLPILRTINAAAFPGVTHESRVAVQQLLDDNKKHHIFFNEHKFHNHVVHHLLDSYAMGCSPDRLREIYNVHLPTQRPAPPKNVKITHTNWKEHLENQDRWTDYMEFFSEEVEQLGIEGAVDKYFFTPELFPRFFAGVNHGIIHLGFGVEFKEPLIVAEGLSLAALHPDLTFLHHILSPSSSSSSSPPSSPSSVLDIFEQTRNDKRFDSIVKEGSNNRFESIRAEKELLHEYMNKWEVKGSDVSEKEKELFEVVALIHGAPVRPGKTPIYDFFIMHALTGSVFVHELLQHFPSDKSALVLRAHLGVTLMYYIAAGRPKLYIDNLKTYKAKHSCSSNPWLDLVRFAIEINDVHATKVIYSLLQYEAWFGECNGILLKVAQMTADTFRERKNEADELEGVWVQEGLAFDSTWQKHSK